MRFAAILLAGSLLAGHAWALDTPVPINQDEPRIRQVEYKQDHLYLVRVPVPGVTQLVFSPQERGKIKVTIAESKSWVHSHGGGSSVMIAANANAPTTYADIVTEMPDGSTRNYPLQLEAAPDPTATNLQVASSDGGPVQTQVSQAAGYAVLRWTYDADDKLRKQQATVVEAARKKQEAAEAWKARRVSWQQGGSGFGPAVVHAKAPPEERKRCDFWYRGSGALMPQAVCDRGDRTTFFWAGMLPVPSIFGIDAAGHPHVATASPNPEVRGEIIVPETSQRWVIVYGKDQVIELFNAAYDPYWTPSQPARVAAR